MDNIKLTEIKAEEIISQLEDCLEKSDLVVLVDLKRAQSLTDTLCMSKALKDTTKKITIISCADFALELPKHTYINPEEDKMQVLLDLYRCYDASDKLILFADDCNYPTMYNYVKGGLLSIDDMLRIMLF